MGMSWLESGGVALLGGYSTGKEMWWMSLDTVG